MRRFSLRKGTIWHSSACSISRVHETGIVPTDGYSIRTQECKERRGLVEFTEKQKMNAPRFGSHFFVTTPTVNPTHAVYRTLVLSQTTMNASDSTVTSFSDMTKRCDVFRLVAFFLCG